MSSAFRLRIERALQIRFDDHWLDGGEELFDVERGGLVALDYVPDEGKDVIEDTVAAVIRAHAADLRAKADELEKFADEFDLQSAARRDVIKLAKARDYDEFLDRFFELCDPANRGYEQAVP